MPAGFGGDRLHALEDLGETRIPGIRDYETDRLSLAGAKAARDAVCAVAHFAGDLQDALTGLGLGGLSLVAAQNPRDGRRIDAGTARHVLEDGDLGWS